MATRINSLQDTVSLADTDYIAVDQPAQTGRLTLGDLRDQMGNINGGSVVNKVTGTIDVARHFRQSSLTENPVVAIIGDSISTDEPTRSFDESESMWGQLQRQLTEANRSLDFTFYNRAIGGSTYTSANPSTNLSATGLTLPDWAGAGSSPWLEYVEALAPDILFVSWGMNDRQNFVTAQHRAVVNAIKSWDKVPDLVFVTPMVPSRFTDNNDISGDEAQNGRLFNAHYIRSWALYNQHAFVDLNRQFCQAVQGFDSRQTVMRRASASTPKTIPHTGAETDQDFGFNINTIASSTLWAGKRITISTSYEGPNSGSSLEIYDNGGTLSVQFVAIDDGPGRYLTVDSAVTTPTSGEMNLSVFIKDTWASIKLDGESIYEGLFYRHGGRFQPVIDVTSGSVGPFNIEYWNATFASYKPVITDYQMWGSPDVGNDVEGGNDLNHPTSLGAATIYRPILENQNWVIPVAVVGTGLYPQTTERKLGVGTVIPKGIISSEKNPISGGYSPNATANNLVLTDENSAGMSFGVGDTGVCRIEMGIDTEPNRGGMSYILSSDILSLKAGNTDAVKVLVPTVSNTLGLQVLHNDGTTTQLKQVSVGAPDSGGVGFRSLRIIN